MYNIKNLILLLLLIVVFKIPSNAQKQYHIPWPSLADSPWPVSRGDMQGTGRSKFVGPRTNNVVWRKDMPLGIFHGPVIGYNDNLFFGTRAYNQGGINYFYSLDKNGNSIWTYITVGNRANVAGTTLAEDGTIYFSSPGTDFFTGGGLCALNANGTLKWLNDIFIYIYYTRYISVAKSGELYLPWFDILYTVNPENGQIIKSIPMRYNSSTEVVFSTGGDTIFYLSNFNQQDTFRINAATLNGTLLWSKKFERHNFGTPLVDNANRVYVYVGEPINNSYLFCLNPDGSTAWQYQMDSGEGFENYSSPTIDGNGNIIFQSSSMDSGYINSVDYYGNLNWKTTLGHYGYDGAFINHGLVCDAEGKIYCGSSLGLTTNFWCLDSDGKILWKLDLEGYEYDTSPAIGSDGTLYIGTHKSSLFRNHQRNLIAVRDTVTSVKEEITELLSYKLEQNFPNPFNSTTNIKYSIPQAGRVTIKVFDLMGSEVATLLDRYQDRGEYDVIFQANNIASGIYFYKIESGNFREIRKMILLK